MTIVFQSEVEHLPQYLTEPDLEGFENEYEVRVPLGNDTDDEVAFRVGADDPWQAIERVRDGYGVVVAIDTDGMDWRLAEVDEVG